MCSHVLLLFSLLGSVVCSRGKQDEVFLVIAAFRLPVATRDTNKTNNPCWLCRRDKGIASPRAGGSECIDCRDFCVAEFLHGQNKVDAMACKLQLKEDCRDDIFWKKSIVPRWCEYMKRKEEGLQADGGRGRARQLGKRGEELTGSVENKAQGLEEAGIYWPESAWRELGREVTDGMVKPQRMPDGSFRAGIVVEDDGTSLKIGCVRLQKVMSSGTHTSVCC